LTINGGGKGALEHTSTGSRFLFSIESPENYYEDFGEDKIVSGICKINIDPLFNEVTKGDYKILLTAYGKHTYLYAEKTDSTYFTVFSDEDIEFSWVIIKHRVHHNLKRFPNYEENDNLDEPELSHQKVLKNNIEFEKYKKNHPKPIPTLEK
jgi:hypothetical protein